ncbi:hypothetical protein [Flavobacterium sp.]|uniref:hypothetical protein n=1 Tax=Flavobacterium sp. TaxID=239 RepID=UPI003752D756
MDNTFEIFERNNKLIFFTKGNILIGLFIISYFTSSQFKSVEFIFRIITVLIIIISYYYFYTQHKRYQILNGKFTGNIIFNKNDLVYNNRKIVVTEIKKIYLRTSDYRGKETDSFRNMFTTRMSNGTNNLLDLTLKSDEQIKCFFKIEFMQHESLKPFVISLLKNNSINFQSVLDILHLDEDYKVNLFQLELNKNETN